MRAGSVVHASLLEVRGVLSRGAFAVAVLTSSVVLFAPAGDVPAAPPGTDKVVHLLLFVGLAVTGRWAGVPLRRLALLLALYAGLSEVLQAVTPLARSGSVADLLADLGGIGVGLAAWRLVVRSGRHRSS